MSALGHERTNQSWPKNRLCPLTNSGQTRARVDCPLSANSGHTVAAGAVPIMERYGADIRLPDLREEIAKCSRQGQMHDPAWFITLTCASGAIAPRW